MICVAPIGSPRGVLTLVMLSLNFIMVLAFGVHALCLYKKSGSITSPTFQRNLKIDLTLCVFVFTSLLVERPLNFYAGLDTKTCPNAPFLMLRVAFGSLVIQALPWLAWIKTITACTALKRSEAQRDQKWTKLLDPSLGDADTMWHEYKRRTFGSPMCWVSLAVVHIVVLAVVGGLTAGNGIVWSVCNFVSTVIINGATTCVWLTSKISFKDTVGLRHQMDLFVLSVGISTFVWMPMYITSIKERSFVFRAIRYFSVCVYEYWACYLLTVIPYKHIVKLSRDGTSESCQTIESIFAEKWKFDLFMAHLLGEFAHENLLFIIEALQFQENCGLSGIEYDADEDTQRLTVPEGIPQSAIVFGEMTGGEKARKIFEKYVDPNNAPLEINVCSATRQKWREYFENGSRSLTMDSADSTATLELFDKTVAEIEHLLCGSLSRFELKENENDFTEKSLYEAATKRVSVGSEQGCWM